MGNTGSSALPKPPQIHLSPGDDAVFQPAPLPVDSDGFIIGFNVEEEEEILTFFEKTWCSSCIECLEW